MQLVLVMVRPGSHTRSFSISREVTVVGRREDCDLRIPLPDVSRRHCRIIKREGSVIVEDLGSANGTSVNGQSATSPLPPLQPGDRLQIGPITFYVQIDGQPSEEQITSNHTSFL